MANAFITEEQSLDEENITELNWSGFEPFRIDEMVRETPEVVSLLLKPISNKVKIDYLAGQYISVRIPNVDNGFDQIRQYSISDWDVEKQVIRISVKTESHGRVSPFIHMLNIGTIIQVSPPQGIFTLNTAAPIHTFISAGIGITPLFSMLKEAVEKHKVSTDKLCFIQCSRSQTHQVYRAELNLFCQHHGIALKQVYELDNYGDHQGKISAEQLKNWVDLENSDIYYCGPKIFMSSLNQHLTKLGVDESRQHYETFGPTTAIN